MPLEACHRTERPLGLLEVQWPKVESLEFKLIGRLLEAHTRPLQLDIPRCRERVRLLHREVRQWHELPKRPLDKRPFVLRQDRKLEARVRLLPLRCEQPCP